MFREKVLKTKAPWLIFYHSPNCAHCSTFEPEFDAAARILEGVVYFGAVDISSDPDAA